MPLAPSIGLSIFIHVGIILWHRFSSLFPKKKENRPLYKTKTGFFGLAIILTISTMILAGALSVIRVSITDEHSSIHYVYNLIHTTVHASSAENNFLIGPTAKATGVIQNLSIASATPLAMKSIDTSSSDCDQMFQDFKSVYKGSLSDYLRAHGRNDSFIARSQLAKEVGIANYTGTVDQNETLLVRLYIQFNGLPENYSSVCHASIKQQI